MSDEPKPPPDAEVSFTPNKGGRPPKLTADEATVQRIRGLALIQCTREEIACALFVSVPTFRKFVNDHPEVEELLETSKGAGKASLRRIQWRLAEKNPGMAIFLGKNYLGQSDKQEHEHSGPGGGPIEYAKLPPEERRARIAELQQRALADGSEPSGGD